MAPRFDFHIHTRLSACANPAMDLTAIVAECERLDLRFIGITDHLNRPEQAPANAALLDEVRGLKSKVGVYFGAEVGFSHKLRAHPLTPELKEQLGFQYAIGSHHSTYVKEYNPSKIIELQHRHHLLTCEDPAMDILGHPYRFLKEEFDAVGWPWIDTMKFVPEKFARELGQAARESQTAVEINTTSNLCMKFNPPSYLEEYIGFLSILADEGVTFSLGSDAHELNEFETIRLAWQVVDRLGIPDSRIWRPASRPASIPAA